MVGTWNTAETNPDKLITHMIGHGRDVHLARRNVQPGKPILRLDDVHVPGDRGIDALRGLDLTIQPGEILGVAGVEGNGQQELAEAIIGLRPAKRGSIVFDGDKLREASRPSMCCARALGLFPKTGITMRWCWRLALQKTPFSCAIRTIHSIAEV